jgi:hypothetical protein
VREGRGIESKMNLYMSVESFEGGRPVPFLFADHEVTEEERDDAIFKLRVRYKWKSWREDKENDLEVDLDLGICRNLRNCWRAGYRFMPTRLTRESSLCM